MAAIVQCIRATRQGGTTTMIGVPEPKPLEGITAAELLGGRKRLVTSIYGDGDPRRLIPTMVGLAAAGRLDLERMVTRRIGLDDVADAFDAMARGDVVRSVITF